MTCLLFTPTEAHDNGMLYLYARGDVEDEQEQVLCELLSNGIFK